MIAGNYLTEDEMLNVRKKSNWIRSKGFTRKHWGIVEAYVEKRMGKEFIKSHPPMPFGLCHKRMLKHNHRRYASELLFLHLFFNKLQKKIKQRYLKRNWPILNRFFADFYFPHSELIIEIDGKDHEQKKDYDQRRDRLIEKFNFKIIRLKVKDFHSWEEELKKYDFMLPKEGTNLKINYNWSAYNPRKKAKKITKGTMRNIIKDQMEAFLKTKEIKRFDVNYP